MIKARKKFKESIFCRFINLQIYSEDLRAVFQHSTRYSPTLDAMHPEFEDYVLTKGGRLESIFSLSEEQIESRVRNIKRANGVPDVSTNALEVLRREKEKLVDSARSQAVTINL